MTSPQECEKCGASIPSGSKFCSECGAPVEDSPTLIEAEILVEAEALIEAEIVCKKCGAVVSSGRSCCPACGSPSGAAVSAAHAAVSPLPPPPMGEADSEIAALLRNPRQAMRWFLGESRGVPLLRRSQLWWDATAIGGGGIAGILWFFYTSMRMTREGTVDWMTPLLMVAIPIGISVFRRQIDRCLLPLNPLRQQVPSPILVGAGLVAPYLTAAVLYGRRLLGFQMIEFPYMRASVVLGTVIAYLIIRTPDIVAHKGPPPATGNRWQPPQQVPPPGPGVRRVAIQLMILVACWLLLPSAVAWADDFLRDPLNARDGLRTPGWAPVLAGTAATVVSIMINGNEVVRTVLKPKERGKKPDAEEEEEPTIYTLDIRTEGQRTLLSTDPEDSLWVSGRALCNKPEIRTGPITAGMTFFTDGPNAPWIQSSEPVLQGAFKEMQLRARAPFEGAELQDDGRVVVSITATVEGKRQTAQLNLQLVHEDLQLEIEVW